MDVFLRDQSRVSKIYRMINQGTIGMKMSDCVVCAEFWTILLEFCQNFKLISYAYIYNINSNLHVAYIIISYYYSCLTSSSLLENYLSNEKDNLENCIFIGKGQW